MKCAFNPYAFLKVDLMWNTLLVSTPCGDTYELHAVVLLILFGSVMLAFNIPQAPGSILSATIEIWTG